MRTWFARIKQFFPKEVPKPLGRWRTEEGHQLNQKIDLSNEDHCGPCGHYGLEKTKTNLSIFKKG